MITKNSVVKIQNIVNHKSQPFKSNPGELGTLCQLWSANGSEILL